MASATVEARPMEDFDMNDLPNPEDDVPAGSEDGVALSLSGGGYRAMVFHDNRRLVGPPMEQVAIR